MAIHNVVGKEITGVIYLYSFTEYIMRNVGLEETQAGIKIARKNINHLRYASGTVLSL